MKATVNFDELTHAATNIVLTAENDYNYYKVLEWLKNCITKKIKRGQSVSVEHLANCSTMQTFCRNIAKELMQYDIKASLTDRKDAALYLAQSVFDMVLIIPTSSGRH